MLLFIQGLVNVEEYEKICIKHGFNPADKKVVFLFPGNFSHHTSTTTLFSIKAGAGLAQASAALGAAGYPTLSLPTTSMENWSNDANQQKIVQNAIGDLYYALGAGYSFMLPARKHRNSDYFDMALSGNDLEPSFWGGIQKASNKPLANYYVEQLNHFSEFINLSDDERTREINRNRQNSFYPIYLDAKSNLRVNDPWLQQKKTAPVLSSATPIAKPAAAPAAKPDVAPVTKPAEKKQVKKSSIFMDMPSSYDELYKGKQSALMSARELLNDYTKNNSALSRFFHGHWNRHHVPEVNALVQKIDKKEIRDINQLMIELRQIKLVNPTGSLARRISFIERKQILDVAEQTESKPQMK